MSDKKQSLYEGTLQDGETTSAKTFQVGPCDLVDLMMEGGGTTRNRIYVYDDIEASANVVRKISVYGQDTPLYKFDPPLRLERGLRVYVVSGSATVYVRWRRLKRYEPQA